MHSQEKGGIDSTHKFQGMPDAEMKEGKKLWTRGPISHVSIYFIYSVVL
jgi:hypothetical protein